MRLEESPVFRKVIVPWYDADGFCIGTMVFLALVMVFAAVGIVEARQTPDFRGHIWVPGVLVAASALVIVSTGLRLIRRGRGRQQRRR